MLFVFAAAPVSAGSATAVISDFNKNLLTVMQSAKKLGYDGRYAKLKPSVKSDVRSRLHDPILRRTPLEEPVQGTEI